VPGGAQRDSEAAGIDQERKKDLKRNSDTYWDYCCLSHHDLKGKQIGENASRTEGEQFVQERAEHSDLGEKVHYRSANIFVLPAYGV